MSVLSLNEIKKYTRKRNYRDRLVITPILNESESFDPSSVNVRLGNEFIIMKKRSFPLLDIANKEEITERINYYQEKIRIDYKVPFILHPNQLIIGSTLEYLSLPLNLMCYVIGKSSWGRMGLIIATATKVDPGFRGCITLEIINEGEVPISLYPGIPIAQLVFHKTTGKAKYEGKYNHPTGPQFPNFTKDYYKYKWAYWFPEMRR